MYIFISYWNFEHCKILLSICKNTKYAVHTNSVWTIWKRRNVVQIKTGVQISEIDQKARFSFILSNSLLFVYVMWPCLLFLISRLHFVFFSLFVAFICVPVQAVCYVLVHYVSISIWHILHLCTILILFNHPFRLVE